MKPSCPVDTEPLLADLAARPGARWADLFGERRVLRSIRWEPALLDTEETRDRGSAARIVSRDGSIRQASATGEPAESASRAVERLLAGPEGGNRDGGWRPQEMSAADIFSGWSAEWLDSGEKRLGAWLERLKAAVEKESGRSARLGARAVLGARLVWHASTGTGETADLRTGVTLGLSIRAGGVEIRRLWGAGSAGALIESRPVERVSAELGEALRRLADPAPTPSGDFPVVLAPPGAGLLAHEAVGHLLEGDLLARGGSALTGTGSGDGESPGLSPLLTVVEDPTASDHRGCYAYDDEGVSARRTVLVERGVVTGAIRDRWSQGDGDPTRSTGNGRRQSHRDPVLPRIASIRIEPGRHAAGEIVGETVRGVFVTELRSGFADPASGEFVLHAAEGRLIENGRLTAAVRDLVLTGTVHRTLRAIDRIGQDASSDGGATSCVRNGQAVPTIVGAPTVRIARMRVSGPN